MKKIQLLFAALFLSLALVSSAFAQAGQWALALRAGPSISTQSFGDVHTTDPFTPADGDHSDGTLDLKIGPMVSGKFSYGVNDYFSVGYLNVEWDTHGIPNKRLVDIIGGVPSTERFLIGGRLHTISLMPFVEFRPGKLGDFSPYLSVALGGNINWISAKTGNLQKFLTRNTFAVKPGAGFDYFITKNLAFNSEVGWKYNRGRFRVSGQEVVDIDVGEGPTKGSGHFNASSVSVVFGLRWYVP